MIYGSSVFAIVKTSSEEIGVASLGMLVVVYISEKFAEPIRFNPVSSHPIIIAVENHHPDIRAHQKKLPEIVINGTLVPPFTFRNQKGSFQPVAIILYTSEIIEPFAIDFTGFL